MPVIRRTLHTAVLATAVLASPWLFAGEVAPGKGDLYSEPPTTVFVQPVSHTLDGSDSPRVAVTLVSEEPAKAPIEAKPFTLKSGDFVTSTKKVYEFYKLDRKGKPIRVKKIPIGTGFKIIKPNTSDTRIQFTSGPLNGRQAFINRALAEEIIRSEGGETAATTETTATAGHTSVPRRPEWTHESTDEGDETALIGTVPDESPEAVAALLKNCKECTARDLKSSFSDKLFDVSKEVVKTVTFQKKKYIYPVNGSRVTSPFGFRKHPLLGYKKLHAGIDFSGNSKTPIQASREGKIIFMGKKGGYGNTIIVQHEDGFTTLYAHMSRFAKGLKKGKMVEQGDRLGNVGASGRVTGPHLHFEIRDAKGRPQPPTKYLGK